MSLEPTPSGVVTLTTDFGHKGPYVASMKGVMLMRFPEIRIFDITHEILVHWPAEAGFWLERAYPYFPRGTVHVAVVDPGVGTTRAIIAGERDGHFFVAPDNGLLASILQPGRRGSVHRLDFGKLGKFQLGPTSPTFHGRDIFAPLAAEIASGRCHIQDLGPVVDEIVPSWVEDPVVEKRRISGLVITTDNFGNLITNIDARLIEPFVRPRVLIAGHELELRRTYGDVSPGRYLALISSFGVLEVARAEESAADGLGVERGAPVIVVEAEDSEEIKTPQ